MKKIVILLICVLFIMVPNYAYAATGSLCSLQDFYDKNWLAGECTHLYIEGDVDYDYLPSDVVEVEGVDIYNSELDDLSFLSKFVSSELSIRNSNVSFEKFDMNVSNIIIFNSNIKNDDLSGLKNDEELESLSIDDCWLRNIDSLSELGDLESFSSFGFNHNAVTWIDLSSLTSLPNLTDVSLLGLEQNLTDDIIQAFSDNGVDTSNFSSYIDYKEQIVEFYNSLNLTGLSDEEKIRKISIFVVEHMNYEIVSGSDIENVVNGKGVCAHYAFLTNMFLEMAGFTSFAVGGYSNPSDIDNSTHAWNIIYLNDEWVAVDNTWLDTEDRLSRLKNGDNVEYFMVPIDGEYANDHIMTTVVDGYIDYIYKVNYYSGADLIGTDFIPLDKRQFQFLIPVLSGYTFDGWYYDNYLTKKVSSVNEINGNYNLYAKWTANPPSNNNDGPITNPGTGKFIILSLIILCLVFFVVLAFCNKKIKNLFRI